MRVDVRLFNLVDVSQGSQHPLPQDDCDVSGPAEQDAPGQHAAQVIQSTLAYLLAQPWASAYAPSHRAISGYGCVLLVRRTRAVSILNVGSSVA